MVEIRTPSKKKRYHVLRNEAKSATAAADPLTLAYSTYHGYRNVIQQDRDSTGYPASVLHSFQEGLQVHMIDIGYYYTYVMSY
jgi:hypothetical protein